MDCCLFLRDMFILYQKKANSEARYDQALIIRRVIMSLIIFLGTEFVVTTWKLHSRKIDLFLIVYCLFEIVTVLAQYGKYLHNCCDKDYFNTIYTSLVEDNK